MPSWWGKQSSKEFRKKSTKESFFDTFQRRFKSPSEGKSSVSQRHCSDTVSERGSHSRAESRSASPSRHVGRCQSFAERTHAQPLPLPDSQNAVVQRTDSGIGVSRKQKLERVSKSSLFVPLPRPACIRSKPNRTDLEGDLVTASVSSASSIDSDNPVDLSHRSPQATDCDHVTKTAANSHFSAMVKEHSATCTQTNLKELKKPGNLSFGIQTSATSPQRRPLGNHVSHLQIPYNGAFCSAPDSSMSSPSRSPMRAFSTENMINSAFWSSKPYDVSLQGSGQCSSPGSGFNSGQNSMVGDMLGQFFWQPSRGSPECSPSPRMTSAGPSSRVQSGAVTPIHPRAVGNVIDSQMSWAEEVKQKSHPLPLPPVIISNTSAFSHSNSASTSPSVPRSPGRAENLPSPGSRWKKGKLLGRGTFGHVYVGFNSESGEMCAMKEVTLFSDDAKSKESAKQLMQEVALLSRLRHPNIVQYYGSETVDDKLYIYLEYVTGGSIYKLLQDYGQLGESAIRSYTQQILSGLAFLHSKSTVHRDIKGANILVDPNGRVKLADFGMAKHITDQSCPLSFKGSPYWMAPEVIRNSNGCNLAVDIWSLGCTVLEMATTKPPWSQFEGVAAMFKIGNGKDLPPIPEHLSEEGKDFVRKCLNRNPQHRPSAAELLRHPFVKSASPLERPILNSEPIDPASGVTSGVKALGITQTRNSPTVDSERLGVHSSRASKNSYYSSDIHIPRNNISCPVSPVGSPLLHSWSPQPFSGRMSPSPISSPRTTSGSSTPLTGVCGAIPINHLKHSVYLKERFAGASKPAAGIYNGLSYHDPNHEIYRGNSQGSHFLSELVASDIVLGKHDGRPAHGELHEGRSISSDRVFQQFLRDHAKIGPSFDLSRNCQLPSRTRGL